ncbi:DUF2188 domain-containing protein [Cupriavidus sp. WKF15]|uniref:DUF2188 domain-containing protein n=1 Tax=Cupriavidus sp. WKF15 TaxID=3032282 RepID=UPI0023E14E5E|nr:DUF2188 domain-containing protein [Cupriavidus sp. WKF15]WER49031.1 DUF2188 domain-containing protein [Cupriavidus sp. WKF15]WER50905.1 DUF2188 domain-containing protein [Cupriavidus sp. WKF15]
MPRNIHVMPQGEGWVVTREGTPKSHYDTQEEAIAASLRIANRDGVQLYIHSRDGRIQRHST